MKEQIALSEARVRSTSAFADYLELTKPRITFLVTLTAAVGYFMASRSGISMLGLVPIMMGTALVSAGASTLNQVLERDADALMTRTRKRALPSGRINADSGLLFGTALSLTGLLTIVLFLNLLTALLAAITLAGYVFVYTPLKRRTTLNTLVGAVPGALPAVGGWAAATGRITPEAGALFLIVFLWQMPHFLALAWILRDDYRRAGFRMLSVADDGGRSTGLHVAISALALLPASLLPTLWGLTGGIYFFGALALSAAYAGVSLWMAAGISTTRARWLFLTSIIYLPAILVMMMLDKLPG